MEGRDSEDSEVDFLQVLNIKNIYIWLHWVVVAVCGLPSCVLWGLFFTVGLSRRFSSAGHGLMAQ